MLELLENPAQDPAVLIAVARQVGDNLNVIYAAHKESLDVGGGVRGGMCAHAALSALMALAQARLNSPVSYPQTKDGKKLPAVSTTPAILKVLRQAKVLEQHVVGKAGESLVQHVDKLQERQLAYLICRGRQSGGSVGHAVVVARIKGELYVVNNQGWNGKNYPEGGLETFAEWEKTWAQVVDDESYEICITSMRIGGVESGAGGSSAE
jgi:hypothetical protein